MLGRIYSTISSYFWLKALWWNTMKRLAEPINFQKAKYKKETEKIAHVIYTCRRTHIDACKIVARRWLMKIPRGERFRGVRNWFIAGSARTFPRPLDRELVYMYTRANRGVTVRIPGARAAFDLQHLPTTRTSTWNYISPYHSSRS